MKNKLMMVLGAVIMIIGLGLLIENLQPKAEKQTAVGTPVLKVEKKALAEKLDAKEEEGFDVKGSVKVSLSNEE